MTNPGLNNHNQGYADILPVVLDIITIILVSYFIGPLLPHRKISQNLGYNSLNQD